MSDDLSPWELSRELARATSRLNEAIVKAQQILAEKFPTSAAVLVAVPGGEYDVLTWDATLGWLRWNGKPLGQCSRGDRCIAVSHLHELADKLGVPR